MMVRIIYIILVLAVIGGHVFFAYRQWFEWPAVADLVFDKNTAALVRDALSIGKSFASYNLSIAVGFSMSFLLQHAIRDKVQLVLLALIVFTASVGFAGTYSEVILIGRLLPAVFALVALIVLQRRA